MKTLHIISILVAASLLSSCTAQVENPDSYVRKEGEKACKLEPGNELAKYKHPKFFSLDQPSITSKQKSIDDARGPTTDLAEAKVQLRESAVWLHFYTIRFVNTSGLSNTLYCNYESYKKTKCDNFLTRGKNKLENISKEGERLSYTVIEAKTGKETDFVLSNPDLDKMTKLTRYPDGSKAETLLQRTGNGTEYKDVEANNDFVHYIEKSDCSGKGQYVKHDPNSNGVLLSTEFEWSSTLNDNFKIKYVYCDYDGCHPGEF